MANLADLLRQQLLTEIVAGGALPERAVPVPNYTLGGRRMRGARPMTVQEQTMLEDPLTQMGRDAGAAATSAINAAGFGLPGIVLDRLAPETAASVRENERLANAGVPLAGTAAGIAAAPVGAIGRGAEMLGHGIASLPNWVKLAGVGIPGLTAPTDAGSPGAAPAKDYEPPTLARELMNAGKSILGFAAGPEERPLTQDEFRAKRQQLKSQTRAEFLQSEVDKVRATDRYQSAGKTLRENLENGARANAEKLFAGYQQDVADESKRIDAEYGDYRAGWDRQRREHLNKQFVERHPTAGTVLTVGGPVASAVATRGIFGKINRMGEDIATAGNTARAADDMRGVADAIVRADKYATYAPAAKAATAAEAAAIPAELRMTADIIDKKSLPPDADARKAAEERMADIPSYAKGMGYDLVSGLVGTGTGSLWSKWRTPSPGVDLYALRNNAAGIDRGGFPEFLRGPRMSQDQLAEALADRAINASTRQGELAAMRRGALDAPAGIVGTPSGGLGPGSPTAAASPAAASSAPPRSSPLARLLMRRGPGPAPDQSPLPATDSSPATLSSILSNLPANSNRRHHSNFQPRGQPDNPGAFKKGKPDYPEGEK
jgi:hypothetical protein